MSEIRYYKGKYKVEIVLKSKGNYRVRAIDRILLQSGFPYGVLKRFIEKGEEFITVPRLLWRKKRGAETK